MTKYKDLKLIDSRWIDSEIEIANSKCDDFNKYLNAHNALCYKIRREVLKEVSEKLIDATPILKETWDAAETRTYQERNLNRNDIDAPNFEQFLETEVKLLNNGENILL